MSEQDDLAELLKKQNALLAEHNELLRRQEKRTRLAAFQAIAEKRRKAEEAALQEEETHVYHVQEGGKGPFRPWTRRDGYLEPEKSAPSPRKKQESPLIQLYPDRMDIEHAAAFLGIKERKLQYLVREGAIHRIKIGRRLVFDKKDLEAYLRANSQ